MDWYETIAKPSWAPPAATFGTVWGILYPIILVAYGYVAYRALAGSLPRMLLLPIAINLIANAAFTPIQFGLKNFTLATVDIVIVLVTIAWSMWAIWPHVPWVTLALVPYLIWVAIATVLQFSLTILNR